jgi:hypothetical protein
MAQISFFAWLGILLAYVTYCIYRLDQKTLDWRFYPGLALCFFVLTLCLGFAAYVVLYPFFVLLVNA